MSKKYKQPKHIRLVKTLKNDLIEGIQEELEYKERDEIDFYDYIFEFVDNYAPYTNDQINLISALMKHPAVDLEEVEDAIEEFIADELEELSDALVAFIKDYKKSKADDGCGGNADCIELTSALAEAKSL